MAPVFVSIPRAGGCFPFSCEVLSLPNDSSECGRNSRPAAWPHETTGITRRTNGPGLGGEALDERLLYDVAKLLRTFQIMAVTAVVLTQADLGRRTDRDYTAALLASLMWNQAPAMWKAAGAGMLFGSAVAGGWQGRVFARDDGGGAMEAWTAACWNASIRRSWNGRGFRAPGCRIWWSI